jgi:hypothetical protein
LADVNANIGINFDTSQALAQLRQLQAGLSRFNQTLTQGNVAAMQAQKGLNAQLVQAINATGKFVATQKDVATSTSSFTQALEKNQLSMRQYFRYTAAAATQNTKVFKSMFAQERETLSRASKDRVKLLQSQYIQMQAANGDMIKVLQVIPKHLKMVNGQYADYATRMQMAAQRQQFLNQLLKQGSTQLLNFGKNTQWAGRQLMVGLTIPLSILGSTAAKTFMEMEQAVTKFSRVYGDMMTNSDATDKAIADIQRLGKEFTKYGIAVKDTIEMAASAAAMGLSGNALNAQVTQATRLAVLGQVEQQQALETTISLTNAFGIASEDLAKKINYLNAVENQTVLSIEDLTIAIPKAGPVVKQLGGSVEDLAFFLTAMKEGGINASEGANALKSGLASMINPSKKASDMLAGLGINIKGIVEANSGDLKGTVVGFARALDTLDPLNRARAIEQLFGKFQFARLSTLFQNVTKDSSQAARALGLAGASVEELAILSERELGKVEDMTGNKFKKSMENLKLQLVPVGKAFLQAVTPIVNFVGKILERFNGLGDGTKKVITVMIGVIGGLAPIALMTFGILANGVANLIKFFAMLRGGIAKLNGSNNVLGGGFDYLTNQQIENLAETNALHTSHSQLISTFNVESTSVNALAAAYGNAASQARALASSSPGLFNSVPGPAGAVAGLPPKKFATGGVVPGTGNSDTVPAMLTPGEVVLTKQTVKQNPELVTALQNGSVKKYAGGTGRQSNPGRTAFNVGEDTLGLAISPKSDKIVAQVEKLSAAMQDGSLGVENGADILKEVFARLADDTRVTITEFVQELRIVTKEMGGVELSPAQINTAAGAIGPNDKLAGHSAGEAGVSQNVRDQMNSSGRGAEFDRLQKIANNTGDRLAQERPDLPRLQRPDKKNVQLDRGHIGAIGATEKGVQEGWDPSLWDLSTHAENEMAQTLASNNEARAVYLEKLKESSATEEEILSISKKVTSNGALNERELQIQSEVLGSMISDKGFMAAEQKKSGKGKPMSIEKTMLATIYDAQGRAENPLPEIAGAPSTEERLAAGRSKVRSRFGKNNSPDVGSDAGFVPLSDSERKAKLDSIRIADEVSADLTAAEQKAETASPSKRTKRLGKDIADGLALGLEEGQAGVKAQSSKLTDAALPTSAETQAKVDKMDLGNKAFYDDINTPSMRDQRQILKSQDRQRRKLGATGTVGLPLEASAPSQTSSLIISSTKKTAAAAEELAIKTEEAVAAESQVVQQIKDESRSRVKIKGNTINIGKDGEQERVVNGINDVADSTTLVADHTDELASITGDAVDAQTQTAGNLLTGAQITDATTGNLNDVLQSTDQTGIAQDDIAKSSENIANLNDDIEKQKKIQRDRLTKMNADEAARLAAENGIIPVGNQSDAKYIDPAKAMGSVEAYDEASTYTKDKNGHLLFDPETGQPTTLTQKQLTKKKRGMRKEKVGKVSGKAAGALGTAAMVAGMAGAPPQVTAALGTAATVAQFAPMIAGTGPIGLAVGAVVALGAGAYLLNKHFNDMAKKAAQFATDLSATRDGLKSIGEMAGRVGASEIMDKRRQTSQYGKYDESIKIDNTFGNKFLGTDVGKKEKKLFQDNAKKFGNSKAVDDLSLKLATAVADGVLDAQAANSIAAELALQLKDQKIEMQIVGQLSALIGPNGEDLKKNPMDTRALLMANANNRVDKTESDIAAGKGNTRENVASVSAYNMNNIQMATMLADQVQVEYETQKKKLEAELAATTNAAKKLAIEQQISALTAQNVLDTKTMNGMLLTQIGLQQKSFDKVFSNSRWGSQAAKEDAYFDGTRNQLQTNYNGTDQEEAAKTFLNKSESFSSTDFSTAADQKTIQTFQAKWEMLVGSKVLSPSEANNYLELFSGQLNNLDLLFNASIGIHGTPKTKELLNMFAGYQNKKMATNMVTQIALTKTNPAEFDATMEALKGIQALDGTTIDMEILLTTLGLEGLEVLKKQMEGIEKLKEAQKKKGDKKMDLEAAKKLGPQENAAITALQANEERMGQFNNLSLEQQAEYLQKLQTQFAYESILTEDQKSAAADLYARNQAWLAQSKGTIAAGADALLEAEKKFKAAFLKLSASDQAVAKLEPTYATGVTSVDPGPTVTPGSGAKKDDPLAFLDALAMRIKMVRDQSFNAKKPIESMLAAFNSPAAKKNVANMFKLFDGLQQKLIALKVPQEFRDYIAGLDAQQLEDLKKADLDKKKKGQQGIFTYAAKKDKNGNVIKDKNGNVTYDKSKIVGISQEGKAIMAAYNEAPLDKFNIAQQAIITDTDNQFKAFNKLKAQEVDTNVALEAVSDSALAAAIASSQLAGTDLAKFVKDLKDAASATEKAAVMADLLKKNADFKFKQDTFPKLASALKIAGLSAENIATVLQDPALAKQLMADLEDGKIDSKAIADYLNSIKDEKIVEIRAKFNAGDFAASAAPGMELVNKMFSVQESLIRTGASKASASMVANVKKLKDANEDMQLAIQQITFSQIRPIEKAIEKATRALELNITRPIEAYQESINDLQRIVELNFERPIATINAENTIMSNDLEIMNHAAEEINKRYDEQAEALQKVSEIKSQIVEQEKEQLDLADALSKGDIGAAARAIQAIRAAQATRNAENASKALELSRKNKIDNLKGDVSGLTKDQITERQYQNAQTIYALENTAQTNVNGIMMTRLEILKEIEATNDKIYNLEEKREAAQLAIRDQEDAIYKITQEQIVPKQDQIDANNVSIATDERAIEKLVSSITVLGQTKDAWDAIGAKIDASALAGEDFDRLMGSMLASVDKIEEGWSKITDTLDKYSSSSAAATGTAMDNLRQEFKTTAQGLEELSAKREADAKIAQAAAEADYKIKKDAYDLEVETLKIALEAAKSRKEWAQAERLQNALDAKIKTGAPIAPVFEPSVAADNPNASYNDPTINAANALYKTGVVTGPTTSNAGGSSSSSSSSSSGSGTSSSTVPGPGQKPPAAGTTTKPPVVATTTKPPVVPVLKPTMATAQDKFNTSAGSQDSIAKQKKKAEDVRDSAKKTLKDFGGYGITTKNNYTYQTTMPIKDREQFDVLYKKYQDAYNYAESFYKDENGDGVKYSSSSAAAKKIREESLSKLPQWAQDAVATIRGSTSKFSEDYAKLQEAKVSYTTEAKKYGVDTRTFESLKGSKYEPLLKPRYDQIQAQFKKMIAENDIVDNARANLQKMGFEGLQDWAFDWNGPSLIPRSPSSGLTIENIGAKRGNDYNEPFIGYATGGFVSSKFAQNKFKIGTDTVPAMLTPGEFVMNKFAVQNHGIGKMQAMNNGQSAGDSVYNYSISVNVRSESNPDEIARTVIAQIKSVDAQKMRGVRK